MSHVDADSPGLSLPSGFSFRRIAIFVSLILVVAAAGSALFLVRTVDSQLADIADTYEVRKQARELMLAMVDAETGQRGFLITEDRSYLEPYNIAVGNLTSTYERLLSLVEDNPTQTLRLQEILPAIDAKRAEMSRTVELASAGRTAEALVILRSDAGLELMDGIRQRLRAFIAEEDARLVERNSSITVYRQSLVVAIFAAMLAAAALAYALLARTQRRVVAMARQQSALLFQNEELEARVRERTAEVEEARARSERERQRVETLLQDTNHRIGNSLATVSSLLGLQLARTQSEEVRGALEAAQARVQVIASGHRRLRLGADLETTDVADFLTEVTEDLERGAPVGLTVVFVTDFERLTVPARDATTIAIVLSELVTNAYKHAFAPGGSGTIWVRFRRDARGVVALVVEDDGKGLTAVPNDTRSGLGALIIRQLANQFGGIGPRYAPRDGGGTSITIELPGLAIGDGQ